MAFIKTEKQVEATRLMAAYIYVLLFGGSRSGKTAIIVRNIIIRACKAPNSRHLIARLRFDHIKRSVGLGTLPEILALCFPDLRATMNKSDWILSLPNGSEIWLTGTDDEERIEKILGNEFSTIYFNESSQFTNYEDIATLLTRLAQNCPEIENKAFFDCNPPSKKHWSHLLFIEGIDPVDKKPVPDFDEEYASLIMNPVDNVANLPPSYMKLMKKLPKRQRQRFLEGKFLMDVEGALWSQDMVDIACVVAEDIRSSCIKPLRRVVAVDPAVTSKSSSDHWGIISATKYRDGRGTADRDVSLIASPKIAIQAAINLYHEVGADAMVVETNQGGDMIEDLLRLLGYRGRIIKVHASVGKFARAEPVSALYEQGLIGHSDKVVLMEEELVEYVPHKAKKSPNRLDAIVWALTELFRDEMNQDHSEEMDELGSVNSTKNNDFADISEGMI